MIGIACNKTLGAELEPRINVTRSRSVYPALLATLLQTTTYPAIPGYRYHVYHIKSKRMMLTILHCLALWESTQHCWPPCCKQSHIICTMLQWHTIHTLPCCITFHLDWLLDITGCLIARYCFHSRKLLETIPVAKRSRCDPHIFSVSKKTCFSTIPFLFALK